MAVIKFFVMFVDQKGGIYRWFCDQNYLMSTLSSPNPEPSSNTNSYRTKNHEAIIKLKEADKHIDVMKRRFKYLQVRDQEFRSKTIQHENKILEHDSRRQSIKKERLELLRAQRLREQETEKIKEKNLSLKEDINKNINEARQKALQAKEKDYQMGKKSQELNEQRVKVIKETVHEEKQEKRKSVNKMEEMSRSKVSRYREEKYKQLTERKAQECETTLILTSRKERELEEMAKYESEMLKKSSESLQASQVMRNRLREVLGDERRFTRLPSIQNKGNQSTRGSTGHTQIITL